MNEVLIKAGCIPYILNYKDMNENGYIEISINLGCYLIAFLQYFPCGDKRYDYYMIMRYKYIKIELIEDLLDKFTEMVVK